MWSSAHLMKEEEALGERASLVPSPSFPQVGTLSLSGHPRSGWMFPHELIFSGETSARHCLINPLASLIKLAMHSPSQAHPILPWWSTPKASSQPVWMGVLGKDALSW